MQEHEIDIALRVQFPAAVTAERHQAKRGKFLLGLGGKGAFRPIPEVAKQNIDQRRPSAANLSPAGAGAVQQLKPMRFDLEKTLVARQVLRGGGAFRQGKPLSRISFNLFEEGGHRCKNLRAGGTLRKRKSLGAWGRLAGTLAPPLITGWRDYKLQIPCNLVTVAVFDRITSRDGQFNGSRCRLDAACKARRPRCF